MSGVEGGKAILCKGSADVHVKQEKGMISTFVVHRESLFFM